MGESQQPSSSIQQITSPKKGAIRTNPLYYLVANLAAANHELVSTYQLNDKRNQINHSDRKAFLLNFTTAPRNILFAGDGFIYKERHLSIDEKYSLDTSEKGGQGFDAAHYTETYSHQSGDELIVHVYFSSHGSTYVFLKINTKNETKAPDLTPELTRLIKLNANGAEQLLQKLKIKKINEDIRVCGELAKLEKKLTVTSNLISKFENDDANVEQYAKFIDSYSKTADEYKALVALTNQYRDSDFDLSDKIVKRICEIHQSCLEIKLNKKKEEPSESPGQIDSLQNNQQPVAEEQKIKTILIQKNETAQMSAYKKILILEKQFEEALQIKDFIKLINITNNIQIAAVECFLDKDSSTKHLKKVEEIKAKAKETSWTQEYAWKLFQDGKNKEFEIIFKLLNRDHQIGLVKQITTEIAKGVEDKVPQQNICEFLFKTSPDYRNEIVSLSSIYIKFMQMEVSILIMIAQLERKQTFEMLLKHGFPPNTYGGTTFKVHYASLLQASISMIKDTFYFKTLMKYGAIVDLSKTKQNDSEKELSNKSIKDVSFIINIKVPLPEDCLMNINIPLPENNNETTLTQNNPEQNNLGDNVKNMVSEITDLEMAIYFKNFQYAPLLVECSSLTSVAIAMAQCALSENLRLSITVNKRSSGIYIIPDYKVARDFIYYKTNPEATVQIVIFAKDNAEAIDKQRLDAMSLLYRYLHTKLVKLSYLETHETIQTILDTVASRKHSIYDHEIFIAARIILCHRMRCIQRESSNEETAGMIKQLAEFLVFLCIREGNMYSLEMDDDLAIKECAARTYEFACQIADVFKILDKKESKSALEKFKNISGKDYIKGSYKTGGMGAGTGGIIIDIDKILKEKEPELDSKEKESNINNNNNNNNNNSKKSSYKN